MTIAQILECRRICWGRPVLFRFNVPGCHSYLLNACTLLRYGLGDMSAFFEVGKCYPSIVAIITTKPVGGEKLS